MLGPDLTFLPSHRPVVGLLSDVTQLVLVAPGGSPCGNYRALDVRTLAGRRIFELNVVNTFTLKPFYFGRLTGYPEVIHTDEKALAIPIFRNPTFSGLRYRRSYWSGREDLNLRPLVPNYESTNSKCLIWCRLVREQRTSFSLAQSYRSWTEQSEVADSTAAVSLGTGSSFSLGLIPCCHTASWLLQ